MTMFLLVTTNKQQLWNHMKIGELVSRSTVGQYSWNLGVLVKKTCWDPIGTLETKRILY